MQPVSIRPAASEDAAGIVRVYMQSAEHHAAIDPARYLLPDPAVILERYRDPSLQPGVVTFVAERAGEIVGFIDVRLERSDDLMHRPLLFCYIVEIAVASELRGSGIGELLMQAAETFAREEGAALLSLEYNAANHGAARFYQRLGFKNASVFAIKWLDDRGACK